MKKCRQALDRKRARRLAKLQADRRSWARYVTMRPPELKKMSANHRARYLARMRLQGKRRRCRALMEV